MLSSNAWSRSLKKSPIDNPYIPGQALELRNSLFVGRQDLVQQLGEALSRGTYQPTFLLTGERRMGKTSTLKQLSDLLGARYFPIVMICKDEVFLRVPTLFLAPSPKKYTKY